MRRILGVRPWAVTGALLVAFAMPYLSAALRWAVQQDDATLYIRADVAAGLVAGCVGAAVLIVSLAAWAIGQLRPRPAVRTLATATVRARAQSRA